MNLKQLLTRDSQKRIVTETIEIPKDRIQTDIVKVITEETSQAIEQAKANVLTSLKDSLRHKRSKLTGAIEHDILIANNSKNDLTILMLNDSMFRSFYNQRVDGVDVVGNLKKSIVTLENTIQALELGQAVTPHPDHQHLFDN